MVMASNNKVKVQDSTYTIVDDYSSVYVVLWEQSNGNQAYQVKTPDRVYGKCPVLGNEPLGEVFPYASLFGIPILRARMIYCHRDYSRWKQFFMWGIHYYRSSTHARQVAQRAALKYKAEQAA